MTADQHVQEWRRARRDFVRSQHPDRGGDPTAFADGLRHFDAVLHGAEPDGPAGTGPGGPRRQRVTVLRRPHGVLGWARHLSRRLRSAAGRPGRSPRVH